jgi:hypothetical protein
MMREGFEITIAAPMNENFQYLPVRRFIRLYKVFGRLFGFGRIRHFDGVVVAFDKAAERMVSGEKRAIVFADYFGLDLSVWNPSAISGNRQTMLLSAYNIPAASKMILVLEPSDKDVRALLAAIRGLKQNDLIIGLYGRMTKIAARRISRRIADSNHQIIYLGREQDLPTLMRASFAIISLSARNSFFKAAALAMGRTTAFPPCDIKPNIVIKNNLVEVLEKIMDIPVRVRQEFEAGNIKRAANYDLSKVVSKLKAKIQNV